MESLTIEPVPPCLAVEAFLVAGVGYVSSVGTNGTVTVSSRRLDLEKLMLAN